MDKVSKRGKIPQSDWPLIMARYESGETLSSIARTYDCSPPAISYIVSRSKSKLASESSAQPASETHLVKGTANGASPNGSAVIEETAAPPVQSVTIRREPPAGPALAAPAGVSSQGAALNGEPRRTLHLSLGGTGNGPAQAADNGFGHDTLSRPNFAGGRPQPNGVEPQASRQALQPPRNPSPNEAERNVFRLPEDRPAAQQPRDTEAGRKDGGSFIDLELRHRVDGDIAAFLAAFDAALAADTHESRFGLREATDRLLRAGARTRIELERLEARVPLPPREGGAAPDAAAWRHR